MKEYINLVNNFKKCKYDYKEKFNFVNFIDNLEYFLIYSRINDKMLDKYIINNSDVINYLNNNTNLFYNPDSSINHTKYETEKLYYKDYIKNLNKIKENKKYIFNGFLNGCLEDNFRYLIDNYLETYLLDKIIINKKDDYVIFKYNKINLNYYYFVENLYYKNTIATIRDYCIFEINDILRYFYSYNFNNIITDFKRDMLINIKTFLIPNLFDTLTFSNTNLEPNFVRNKHFFTYYLIMKMIKNNKIDIITKESIDVLFYSNHDSKLPNNNKNYYYELNNSALFNSNPPVILLDHSSGYSFSSGYYFKDNHEENKKFFNEINNNVIKNLIEYIY